MPIKVVRKKVKNGVLTKAQAQDIDLTGQRKRDAAAKLRADRAKQKAARKKEAARVAAEKRKMKMVDRAVLLGGSVTVGAGIGNKLADQSIKTELANYLKMKQLATNAKDLRLHEFKNRIKNNRTLVEKELNKIRKEGSAFNKGGHVMKKSVKRKDGSSKEGEITFTYEDLSPLAKKEFDKIRRKDKEKFEKEAEKLLKSRRFPIVEQPQGVGRSAGSPPTGEVSKPQGVGAAVKGYGKAMR